MPSATRRSNLVPNAPIREAVEDALRRGVFETMNELSDALGHGQRESSRLRRALGLLESHGGRKPAGGAYPPRKRTEMTYENAVQIVRAIGRDPVEFGL